MNTVPVASLSICTHIVSLGTYVYSQIAHDLEDALCPEFLLLSFSLKVLEKLLLCEKIPHEKSYLNIFIGNQGSDNLVFVVF